MDKKHRINLQAKSCDKILLFKVRSYFKIYNEGVFLLKDRKYKINLEFMNNSGLALSITITRNIFEELRNEFSIQEMDQYYILYFSTKKAVCNCSDYKLWRAEQMEKRMQQV